MEIDTGPLGGHSEVDGNTKRQPLEFSEGVVTRPLGRPCVISITYYSSPPPTGDPTGVHHTIFYDKHLFYIINSFYFYIFI